jgi:GNAT superfamily N-acetyltransferase
VSAPFDVVPLDTKRHDRKAFTCGVAALDEYLKERAAKDLERRLNTVFVLIAHERPAEILGYYTLCASTVPLEQLPEGLRKRLPNRPLGVTLLGKFATVQHVHGQGLGTALLGHAIRMAYKGSLLVASSMLVLDAKDERVARFYVKRGRFIRLADSLRCILPMKTIEQALREEDEESRGAAPTAPQVSSERKSPSHAPAPHGGLTPEGLAESGQFTKI